MNEPQSRRQRMDPAKITLESSRGRTSAAPHHPRRSDSAQNNGAQLISTDEQAAAYRILSSVKSVPGPRIARRCELRPGAVRLLQDNDTPNVGVLAPPAPDSVPAYASREALFGDGTASKLRLEPRILMRAYSVYSRAVSSTRAPPAPPPPTFPPPSSDLRRRSGVARLASCGRISAD